MQLFRNCLRSFLLCFLMLCYGITDASAAWQKDAVITLQAQQITLGKIFKAILQQTGIKIMYAGKMVNEKEVYARVQFKATKLEDALQFLFKGKGLEWIYRDEVIILRPRATDTVSDSIPTLNVSGRVLDEAGAPLPGATVLVKGTGKGAAADVSGNFRVAGVPSNATLAVSFTGFEQQEVSLRGRSELALSLKRQAKTIDKVEVFSTGYQDVPKERATGSFEFVNNEELNRRVGSDILSRLEGVTTSILFDRRRALASDMGIGLNNLIIRGLSTLDTDLQSPLIVVDNFPYDGNINNINPNDVENITILKDAAAASIWGARAANGVIVINTKKGQFNQPAKLSFNANMTITEKPDLFHFPRMSSSEFIDVESFLFGKGYYNNIISNSEYPGLSDATEILLKRRSGLISAADSAAGIDALRSRDMRHDFERYIYRTAISQQYALNLTGGSDKVKYAVSGGFDRTPSILKGDNYKRITLNSDNSFTPIKKLILQLGVRFTSVQSTDNSLGDIGANTYSIRENYKLPSYARLADDQGNYLSIPFMYREGYTDTAGAGRLLDWKYRPLQELDNADLRTKEREFVINTGVNYKLTDFLSLQANYQFQFASIVASRHFSKETYFVRDLVNLFTNFNTTVPSLRYPMPIGGVLSENRIERNAHMGRGQLNFNHSWRNKHQVNGVIGSEIRENINTGSAKRTYGYDEDKLTFITVDNLTSFPQYGNRGNARVPAGTNGYTKTTDHFVSFYGNAAYTYDNRYTISASGRRDAANQFGVDVNDQWKPFWSLGASWNIANEPFFKVKAISYLRFRTNYGYQGNVNNKLSPYTILSYQNASALSNNIPYANISTPANPGLSWETTKQFNAGLDFRIAGNRLSGSLDVYQKNSNDLILSAPMDFTSGVTSVLKNSASMKGNGIDVLLNSLNVNGRVQWRTELGFSYVTNKVTDFLTDGKIPTVGNIVPERGIFIVPRINRTPYSIFSYPFAGLDPLTGDPQGYSGQKVTKNYVELSGQRLDTGNIIYHGSAIPTIFGNINNSVRYRGISLSINISYRFNYYFRKNTISYSTLYSNGIAHADFSKRWKQPGDEKYTTVPSMIYPTSNANRDLFYAYSSVNVLKGDNIRLNNIRLSYDLGNTVIKRLSLKQVQVYMNVENLGIIWRANKEGLDPDYDTGNTAYMPPKRIAFGLRMDL
ncbi:SusC/RagA family TonB-linked outer membrane protein [Chitinophaga sp. SYP-B3965]|uniref:SusC/RagA family TonB-linked outer membrane protein n=1 Tax=Chitinophaga sp. SYP-B3965 TaxID=2663120 RepID=UPI00129955A8|nr:SusC/RagA family TonB-linked outer membrane protein [Chitinophaga sp. SYP-B3965]MRG45847.1 SusC/RagA family TonB-linked outer membrane protein [Chitinophaga sp. SYP-B3965]